MIRVNRLTKRYGTNIAVNQVGFEVGRGEIVGLLGPNGAGKTTIMNILTGYISTSEGTARIGGYDVLEAPDKVKALIGYLPEVPPLYPDMTVSEYLSFVYDLKKCKLKKEPHLEEVQTVTKLQDVSGRLIRNLSKGYKQRVGLAQALVGNPPILILDEPTVGLDPREVKEIRGLIKRLGATHTILLSSHILTEIQAICQRVLIINGGYLVRDELTEDLLNEATTSNRFAVRLVAPKEEALRLLPALEGVASVEFVGTYEKGTIDLIITVKEGADIRRTLFDFCAKHSWYILMITPLGISLEDVFIQLTGGSPIEQARALAERRRRLAASKKEENQQKGDQ